MSTASTSDTSILVLGPSNTGKTHFIIQLYGRLRVGTSALKLRGTPKNLTPFDAALTRLNEGLPAIHTAADAFDLMKLPMMGPDGNALDFLLPDYGGEQVRSMMDDRRISPEWEDRVQKARGWLFFLRPNILTEDRDFVTRPIEGLLKPQTKTTPAIPSQWSDQARFIEFLQLLLYARGVGITQRVAAPALGIILSCWDELKLEEKGIAPAKILKSKMPLLTSFIEANWQKSSHFVLGLSSLERPLDEKNPDQEFINRGPDKFGYVVTEDGEHTHDLSPPLTEILRRSK